jgi:hypothetical protein
MSPDPRPARQPPLLGQPTPVLLIVAVILGTLIALATGGLLLIVYVLNHGVDPAWIIFLTSSLRHWEAPLH